jgi:prevent-host-death family protein
MSATVTDAKLHLSAIIARAESGKETVITMHNKPAAKVVPLQPESLRLTERWRERRKSIRLNRPGQRRLSISQLIQEGRK